MAQKVRRRRGGKGRAFVVNNDHGNLNHSRNDRNEIEEWSTQIANLNDEVQRLLLNGQVAT